MYTTVQYSIYEIKIDHHTLEGLYLYTYVKKKEPSINKHTTIKHVAIFLFHHNLSCLGVCLLIDLLRLDCGGGELSSLVKDASYVKCMSNLSAIELSKLRCTKSLFSAVFFRCESFAFYD